MSKVYNGNTPELYELFLKGTELQYRTAQWNDWHNIPVYNGRANDIYRVANPNYEFKIKPTEVIVKKYTFCDRIEIELEYNSDLNYMQQQQHWWDFDEGMCGKYLEWVFVNNKLTAVNVIGED